MQRNTVQASLILETMENMDGHKTADQIYDEIIKKYPSISKATVYRNLKKLCKAGKIKKIEIPNCADYFERTKGSHYHVQCIKCGIIADVNMDYMENLEETIHKTDGFIFFEHNIIFNGICPKCINKEK